MPVHALIIDDDARNVQVLAQYLSKQDVSSSKILQPADLSATLQTLPPIDLVFLDLEFPTVDGYTVKDQVRTALGQIPIIAYTVHVSEINAVKAHGFDGFIGKPLDNKRFPDQLARILRGEAVWDRV
jgi:CheY-like chemotaxis protein